MEETTCNTVRYGVRTRPRMYRLLYRTLLAQPGQGHAEEVHHAGLRARDQLQPATLLGINGVHRGGLLGAGLWWGELEGS